MKPVALAVSALMLLAACDQPAPSPAPEAPAPSRPAPVPSTPAPAPVPGVAALGMVDASGAVAMRLTCSRTAPRFKVSIPGFQPIASEDRLSLGGGGEAYALAADLNAPGPGVTASGDIDPGLIQTVGAGEPIQALYGQQEVGPLTASSPSDLAAFVAGCGG